MDKSFQNIPIAGAKGAVIVIFLALHLYGLDLPPNGFHTWREVDTATVIENYSRVSMNFFEPRVNVLGLKGDGIVGMEFPVYSYIAALPSYVVGLSHLWPRLLSALSGILFILFFGKLCNNLFSNQSSRPWMPVIPYFLAGFNPLVLFYSSKIQPDVLGLALSIAGFVCFMGWRQDKSRGAALLSAIFLAVSGGIKPNFLCVGLPMLTYLILREGWPVLRQWSLWVYGLLVVSFPMAWIFYAQGLSRAFGEEYFYLGQAPLAELTGLLSLGFYQNVFLTWPIELVFGPTLIIVILWLLRIRFTDPPARANGIDGNNGNSGLKVLISWFIAGFLICMANAQHCATPHDYYYLVLVPPILSLVFVACEQRVSPAQRKPSDWWPRAVGALLLLLPVYSAGRVSPRIAATEDFWSLRQAVAALVPQEDQTKVLSIDRIPGKLLYFTGLRGRQMGPAGDETEFSDLLAKGVRYILVAQADHDELRSRIGWFMNHKDQIIYAHHGILLYKTF